MSESTYLQPFPCQMNEYSLFLRNDWCFYMKHRPFHVRKYISAAFPMANEWEQFVFAEWLMVLHKTKAFSCQKVHIYSLSHAKWVRTACFCHREQTYREVSEINSLLEPWNHNNKYRILCHSIVFMSPPGWGNRIEWINIRYLHFQRSRVSDWEKWKKSVRNAVSMIFPSLYRVKKNSGLRFLFVFVFWWDSLGGRNIKKIDKFKIPNEKLLDQGGSTLKSP